MTGCRTVLTITYSVLLIILGSCTNPEGPDQVRWRFIEDFGSDPVTELYVNSTTGFLMVMTGDRYGKINSGSVQPELITDLPSTCDDPYKYVPFITDQYFFTCNEEGDQLHIGNAQTGEHLDTIHIEEIVAKNDLPAVYTRSSNRYNSNLVEYHNGLYMISIRHDPHPLDDWLYFGGFNFDDEDMSFETSSRVRAYEVEGTGSVYVRSNYYYGGYFWQYRTENFSSNVCAVNENDFSVIYTTFIPAISGVYEYNGVLLGFFGMFIKKSYDGGFTWHDWAVMNASWNHTVIDGVNVMFISQNIASANFDLVYMDNYDSGELAGHCIINLVEFDGKVFAGTLDGLFYCDLEDFFVLKPELHREGDADLEIILTD